MASGKPGMAAVSRRLAKTDGLYIVLEHTKRYATLYALWTAALVAALTSRKASDRFACAVWL